MGPGTSDINAVRAFMLLGFFAQMGAVLVCLLLALAKTENKTLASIFFAISGERENAERSIVNANQPT